MINQGIKFKLGDWKAYGFSLMSKATWLAVPALDAIFDIGWCVEPMRSISRLFISHLHQDHSLAMPTWIVWRQPYADEQVPSIYVHPEAVADAQAMVEAVSRAERTDLQYDIIGMPLGEKIQLKDNFYIKAFETRHNVPTIGFMVYERRQKLKAEYSRMDGEGLRKARLRKEHICEDFDFPKFCYVPDTDEKLLEEIPELLKFETLMIECSLLDGFLQFERNVSRKQINNVKHIDIRSLSRFIENFSGKNIYVCHLPQKYDACNIHAFLLPRLPPQQRGKLQVFPYRQKPENKNDEHFSARIYDAKKPVSPILLEQVDTSQWDIVYRPGYFGHKKAKISADLQSRYPGYRIAYEWDDGLITRESALQLYEDAYYHFLEHNPELLEWLTRSARDVYDTDLFNIDSGLDYAAQPIDGPNHLQDIAIRRVLVHMGKWFEGNDYLQIRGLRSEGYVLNPGIVPFHRPEMIHQPRIKMDWVIPGSVESFWQSNKVVIMPRRIEKNANICK